MLIISMKLLFIVSILFLGYFVGRYRTLRQYEKGLELISDLQTVATLKHKRLTPPRLNDTTDPKKALDISLKYVGKSSFYEGYLYGLSVSEKITRLNQTREYATSNINELSEHVHNKYESEDE